MIPAPTSEVQSTSFPISFLWRYGTGLLLLAVCMWGVMIFEEGDHIKFWGYIYTFTLLSSFLFFYKFRGYYFTIPYVYIALHVVGVTLAVVPYLYFDIGSTDLRSSLFLNSLGLLFSVSLLFIFLPLEAPSGNLIDVFHHDLSGNFFRINRYLFLFTIPMVFLVMVVSGGWKAYFGLQGSGFDRISSLKGMGPLMIFSYINVLSGTLYSVGFFLAEKKKTAIILLVLCQLINSFTFGRGNFIMSVLIYLFFIGTKKKLSLKVLVTFIILGIFIVFLKFVRAPDNVYGYSNYLLFFMNFSGDFDSVKNTQSLLAFIENSGYPGFYHIWSNVLVYVPRFLFADKPQSIGGLYLDKLVFPGLYTGDVGSTGFSFGIVGVFFAVAGMSSLAIGLFLVTGGMAWLEHLIKKWSKAPRAGWAIIIYCISLGQTVILYRDGIYAFINVLFYGLCYALFYKLFSLGIKSSEVTLSPRHTEEQAALKLP